MALIDLIDYPQLRYGPASNADLLDGALAGGLLPPGQYAFASERGASVYLARDPLGCNKLFFGYTAAADLVAGNRLAGVWRAGVPLTAIASCPPGHVLEFTGAAVRKAAGQNVFDTGAATGLEPEAFARETRAVLDDAFAWLGREFAGCQFVVCLSGGLDSSVIASFAAAHLRGVAAATFTYLDDDDSRRHALGTPAAQLSSASDDFRAAARVAAALGLPVLDVVRPRQSVASAVRPSVQLCQDWRDFNVHCATVNLFLAQSIRAAYPGRPVVVLTGDLMNEFVADYRSEDVDGTTYYRVPRVDARHRRQYFVRGLDAGDREIGVFASHGLICCQPFALLATHYMRVPPVMLDAPDIKWTLNGPLLAGAAAAHVSRSKTRAQVGGADLGTLGLYHRLGIGDAELRQVWQQQFPDEPPAACDQLIHFGRYRLPEYGTER